MAHTERSIFCRFIGILVSAVLLPASTALGQRALGAGALVLDDGHGHTITLLTPPNLDGNYIYTLPQSPGGSIMSGYVQAGNAFGQILYWNGSYWQPSVTGTSGQVLTLDGSGTPTWEASGGGSFIVNGTSLQNAASFNIDGSGQVGTTFNISSANGAYQIGGNTILSNPGTQNLFLGVGASEGDPSGTNNTTVGYGSYIGGYGTITNSTAIGADAFVAVSNTIQLGNSNVTTVNSNGSFNTGGSFQTGGITRIDNSGNGIFYSVNSLTDYQIGGNTILSNPGTQNLFLGVGASEGDPSGTNNTTVGYGSYIGGYGTITNSTAIGADAFVVLSNMIQLGNSSVTTVNSNGSFNTGGSFQTGGVTRIDNSGNGIFYSVASSGTVTLTGLATGTPANYLALDGSNHVVLTNSAGGVSGTGTKSTIAIWSSSTTLSNSLLTDDGTTLSYASKRINTDSEYAISGNKVFTTVGGMDDVFAGYRAGLNISGGYADAFFGFDAGRDNSTGDYNTFVGSSAGQDNNSGHDNTYTGSAAGQNNTSGEENTFDGRAAGNTNSIGSFNTFVGGESGTNNSTGSNNTILGQSANVASGALTDATAIGANAIVSASNTMQLGDSNVMAVNTNGTLQTSGGVIITPPIGSTNDGMDINNINPGTYDLSANNWSFTQRGNEIIIPQDTDAIDIFNNFPGTFDIKGTNWGVGQNGNGAFQSVNTDTIKNLNSGDNITIEGGTSFSAGPYSQDLYIQHFNVAVKDGNLGVGTGRFNVGSGAFSVQHDGSTTISGQDTNDALTINGGNGGNDITGTGRNWYVDGSGFLYAGNGMESDNGLDVSGTEAHGDGIFVQNGGVEINNDMLQVDGDGADIAGPTRLENDYSDVLTIVGSGSHNDVTGTSGNWQVDGSGNGTFNTLAASGTINSTGGSLQTNSTTRIDSVGTFRVGGNLFLSTESDASSGDAVTVSGDHAFAEITGSGTGNVAVTVTDKAAGQILYLYDNVSTMTLSLNGSTVAYGTIGVFIYYGGNWIRTN